jgi:transcriptional regulator with XRE-family HTH domain
MGRQEVLAEFYGYRHLPSLRRIRVERLMTQEQLAAKAGLTLVTISQLENGHVEPRLGTVQRLATALRVQPEALLREGAVLDKAQMDKAQEKRRTEDAYERHVIVARCGHERELFLNVPLIGVEHADYILAHARASDCEHCRAGHPERGVREETE